jgi:hypothetical protein
MPLLSSRGGGVAVAAGSVSAVGGRGGSGAGSIRGKGENQNCKSGDACDHFLNSWRKFAATGD